MPSSARMTFEILPEAMVVTVNAPKMDYMIVDSLQRRISAQATMAGKVNVILDLGHPPSPTRSAIRCSGSASAKSAPEGCSQQ